MAWPARSEFGRLLGRCAGALKRRFPLVLAGGLLGLLGGGAYVMGYCPPQYRSEATVLLRPSAGLLFEGGGQAGNAGFSRNQLGLLRSRQMAQSVLKALKQQHIQVSAHTPEGLLAEVLTVRRVPGTDFIQLGAKAPQAKAARQIAQAYLGAYQHQLQELSLASLKRQQALLQKQAEDKKQELAQLSGQLRQYQERFGASGLADDGRLKVQSLEAVAAGVRGTEAELAESAAEIAHLRNQLQLKNENIHTAILAAAEGQDRSRERSIEELHAALKVAEQAYAEAVQTVVQSNQAPDPELKKLEERIALMRREIVDQSILNVSLMQAELKEGAKPAVPKVYRDTVRQALVGRLAQAEFSQAALQKRLSTLKLQSGKLEGELKQLPAHQVEYARLSHTFEAEQKALTRLDEKLDDKSLEQSAWQDNLTVIDPPGVPRHPMSLPVWQWALLSGGAGLLLSTAGVLGFALVRPAIVSAGFMESVACVPVLGLIPWVSQRVWQCCRSKNTLEVLMSPVDAEVVQAYQDIALNMKARRDQDGRNALAVASLHLDAEQPVLLGNLAYCLAQSGQKVVVVDTNLRNPNVHELFGQELDYEVGLIELINGMSEVLYHKPQATVSDVASLVASSLTPSGLHPGLSYINAGVPLENTFEFLNSRGFAALVETLKVQYDWVLFNAPPLLGSLDTSVELSYLDGLLLFVERDATEAQVQAACHRVHRLNSTIIGCTLRGAFAP